MPGMAVILQDHPSYSKVLVVAAAALVVTGTAPARNIKPNPGNVIERFHHPMPGNVIERHKNAT